MSRRGVATAAVLVVVAIVGLFAGSTMGASLVAIAVLGLGVVAVTSLRIRAGVVVPVLGGTVVGGLIGMRIVHILCLPGSCTTAENTGALLSALGSFAGVGLVVALVQRSFDEYRQAVAEHRPPPTPGCETDPQRE